MTIRLRLLLAVLLVVALGTWPLYNRLVEDLRPRYLEAMEESMVDMAEILAAVAAQDLADGGADRLDAVMTAAKARRFEAKIYALLKDRISTEVILVDAAGAVLFDSSGESAPGDDHSQWNDVIRTMRGEYGARATRLDPDDPQTLVMHVAAPVMVGGDIAGVLTVRRPVDQVTFFMAVARANLLFVLVVAGAAVAAVAAGIAMWLTRPLHRLERYVTALRRGERRAPPRLSGEVGRVAAAMEELRDALEGRHYAERYVQHLTHELKSPLSAIGGAAELLDEDMDRAQRARFLKNIRGEVARIQDVVDRLLQLSSLEARKHLEVTEPVDMGALARRVAEECAVLAAPRSVTIDVTGEGITVEGDPFLLHQALRNLVANAVDFAQSSVRIELSADALAVVDDGPGIPDYARERVTERFYSLPRPDGGAKGTGLGLTFVAEVVQLHGAELVVGAVEGGGARVGIRFQSTG